MTTVLLTDGLAGTGEDLVQQMFERMHSVSRIVGGAAAMRRNSTELWSFGRHRCGRFRSGAPRLQSQAMGRRSRSRPAPDLQPDARHPRQGQRRARDRRGSGVRGVSCARSQARNHAQPRERCALHDRQRDRHPFFRAHHRARAPLSTDAKGALTCAASIPEGSMITILDGEPDNMIQAARRAAESAKAGLEGAAPAGVLLFDCVCRGMILKDGFRREIEAVRSVFGGCPSGGFSDLR